MKVKDYSALFLFGLLSLVSSMAMAESNLSSWSIKGFGTLAATGTDTDQIGFYRDTSQTRDVTDTWGLTTDSRLGLQVDWHPADRWQATVQWVLRDHAGNIGEQNLDWAYLRWNIQHNLDIRLGRVGTDVFLLSDYRNVGYAYPWMRPPHEFYSKSPLYHIDGLDIIKKFAVDDGFLSVKLFAGHLFNQLPQRGLGTFNSKAIGTGTSLRYENDRWQARFGYTFLYANSELPIQDTLNEINSPLLAEVWPDLKQISPLIRIKNKSLHYITAGISYDDSTWLIHTEASFLTSNSLWFRPQTHAYFSLGRRFSTVTLYSLLGIAKTFQHDTQVPNPLPGNPDLIARQQQLSYLLNNTGINEQSVSIGTRWDFYENMALKAQWSHYWLGSNSPQQWQQSAGSKTPDTVNVMSVGIDFIF